LLGPRSQSRSRPFVKEKISYPSRDSNPRFSRP